MKIKQRTTSLNGFLELYLKEATYYIEWKIFLEKKPQLVFNILNISIKEKKTQLEEESLRLKFLKPKIKKFWINNIMSIDHVKKLVGNKKIDTIMWAKK